MSECGKITCNVIQDLIPSYVDGICSQDSRNLVMEHIKSCAQCKNTLDMHKNVPLTAEKIEKRQINYMQRIKQDYFNKSMTGFRFLAVLVSLVTIYLLYNYAYHYQTYFIVQPLLILGSYFLIPRYTAQKSAKRISGIFFGICVLTIMYTVVLTVLCYRWIVTAQYPYGIALDKLGPFIVKQLLSLVGILYFIFSCSFIIPLWNIQVKKVCVILPVIGWNIALIFITALRNSITPYVDILFSKLLGYYLLLMAEGGIMTLAIVFYEKHWQSSK